MMSMAAAGMAGNGVVMNGVGDAGTGVPTMPPPPAAAPTVPDASALAAAAAAQQLGGAPVAPAFDPSMAQAYAQMFSSYLQQAQAYSAFGADPGMASGVPFAAAPPLPNYNGTTTP